MEGLLGWALLDELGHDPTLVEHSLGLKYPLASSSIALDYARLRGRAK
jgi:hypothetical protein